MLGLAWFIIFFTVFLVLTYQRASLIVSTLCFAILLVFLSRFAGLTYPVITAWIIFFLISIFLNIRPLRRRLISQRILNFYRQVMPAMSKTEKEAIDAGTITWEGDLFRGNPDWHKLLAFPNPKLTAEEQDFLNGPVETLCKMVNDWEITYDRLDLSPELWSFIKENGFFGLIIPKKYGGKEFSAYAHSQVLIKISGMSITTSTTISVPNSLGPAELLLHYGTDEQKNYYLPRLAKGEEIPCFALTSPDAGSDASAMTDHGVVCWGEINGEKKLGIRLHWNKRYITLAPIATVIGLAFKLYDPENLIGKRKNVGITCALIPRHTPGITIGRRHIPLSSPFQNGPIQGKDVFIPLEWIIGGVKQAGKGWRMLMECLSAGRAITLPSTAIGGMKVLCYVGGAYARIRRQFHLPIGRFEGIEEPLARIGAWTYMLDAARKLAVGSIDLGEKPAIASAITKYHVTELGRKLACDGMDIHGGKGICLGPKNYIGRSYQSSPIAITVEGANILTRNLIIFGQGAIRCHPYVLPELIAAGLEDQHKALKDFDQVIFKHMGYVISNLFRTILLGLTNSVFASAPRLPTKRYFQHATRFSASLAFFTDMAMVFYGSKLKRKESVSARLGDILSYLYILSAALKEYHVQNQEEDIYFLQYACEFCLFEIQTRFIELIKNFPNRVMAFFLRMIIFPLGQRLSKPKDYINHKISKLLIEPTNARQRLTEGIFLTPSDNNLFAQVQDALIKCIAAEPIEKIIKNANDQGNMGYTISEQAQTALENKIINAEQYAILTEAEIARKKIIAVDDFAAEELTHG
jgi:acyl-CoA dehydrogenase